MDAGSRAAEESGLNGMKMEIGYKKLSDDTLSWHIIKSDGLWLRRYIRDE